MRRALFSLLVLTGCAFSPPPAAPNAFYDLGPAPNSSSSSRIDTLLLLEPVHAPPWLQSNAIVYRLEYGEDARHQSYAQSHWVGTPADLFNARLARGLAEAAAKGVVGPGQGIQPDYSLRVELIEFAQVFDSPRTSEGVVRLRATLVESNPRALVAQKTFAAATPANSPNASGAVQAIGDAADAAIVEIVDWLSATLKPAAAK